MNEVLGLVLSLIVGAMSMASTTHFQGYAGWAVPSLGESYLAIRASRGTVVTICAARCVTMTSTDYGPSSKIDPPRVADIAVEWWEKVCDLPRTAGLCFVTIRSEPVPLAPATDIGG